eukprot:jgi/Hompol1/2763/HPOL_003025-RA
MVYSLGTRCTTEFLATALAIFLGDSVIANELLPGTKGHAMGFGFVAIGFGASFGVAIMMFGYASSHMNPSMALALWVIGRLNSSEFFSIAACEIAGGFIGALAMYLTYLPHFRTIPEPHIDDDGVHHLLRSKDTIDPAALRIASYNTRSSPSHPRGNFKDRLREARYYLTAQDGDTDQVLKILSIGTLDLAGVEVPFPSNDVEQPMLDVLILGALLLDDRFSQIKNALASVDASTSSGTGGQIAQLVFDNGLTPFFVSLFIQLCVLALGGPTGFTANPARDLGPRFAHWILPISGKGHSEWNYCAVVFAGNILGGIIGGSLFLAIQKVHGGI